jgi:hypothetical protein
VCCTSPCLGTRPARCVDRPNDRVTLFSAMIYGKGVTSAQVRVPDGTNEITQVERAVAAVAPVP